MRPPELATADRWRALNGELGVAADERTYRKLIKAWGARSRHYHTLVHLDACLREFDSARSIADRPAEAELALWFHDAIYKTYSKQNEARSAEWAAQYLLARGAQPDVVRRVRECILATRHAAGELTGDCALVVDIDLAILGQPPAIYDLFERNVRKEYWWVSKRRYVKGRTAILRSFLDRPRVYVTEVLRARYEYAARENLRGAIERLRSS